MKRKTVIIFLLWILICIFALESSSERLYAQEYDEGEMEVSDIPERVEYDHYSTEHVQTYAGSLTGQINNVVVFIRFNDSAEYVNETRVNYADIAYNTGESSLKKYLERISYGEINIDTYFFPGNNDNNYFSVQVSHNEDYYKRQYTTNSGQKTEGYANETERVAREDELIKEAIEGVQTQLEQSGLDLDLNRDGFIDSISFVVPTMNGGSLTNVYHGDLLWPHKTERFIGVPINGTYVYAYNLVSKGTDNYGIMGEYGQFTGTIIHEFLHTLSLPDLYRYKDSIARPLGAWDIMDYGSVSNITAWYQREYLEFGAKLPVYTESVRDITLSPARYTDPNEIYAIILKSERNPNEYFVVENRVIESGVGEGQKNSGLLVYRIMNSSFGPFPAGGNCEGPPDFIYAFRPNESGFNAADGDIAYATLSPDNPKGFTYLGKALGTEEAGYDNHVIYYTDGSNSGIVIDNIRTGNNGAMTFDVTFPDMMPGDGTKDSPYEIYSVTDLKLLSNSDTNTYYKLMNDLDMTNYEFSMIMDFKGIFDGNNKTIKGLKVTESFDAAFFDNVNEQAVVKNLVFLEPEITASNGYAGIFAMVQGRIENVSVIGGAIRSGSRAGGLVGVLNEGNVINCYSSADVAANQAGGLLSYVSGGTITNSYACGKVSGVGEKAVIGGVFAFWMSSMNGQIINTYWDVENTEQQTNGLIWENNTQANPKGVYGISLQTPDSVDVAETDKAVLIVSNDGDIPQGTWKSSDTAVITVDKAGKLTGKGGGTADISYEFTLGGRMCILTGKITCIGNVPPVEEPVYEDEVEAFVARFYVNILNRQADEEGLKAWTQNLKTGKEQGANVGYGFINSDEFKQRNLSDEEYLSVLYYAFFDREPDNAGKAAWQKLLDEGVSRLYIYRGFAESEEFTVLCQKYNIQRGTIMLLAPMDQNEGVTRFLVRCYRLCLNREPDESGLNGWSAQLLSGKNTAKEAAHGFVFSEEFFSNNLSDEQFVEILYRVFMNREGEPAGVDGWVRVLQSGYGREHVFDGFADSAEFRELCDSYGIR